MALSTLSTALPLGTAPRGRLGAEFAGMARLVPGLGLGLAVTTGAYALRRLPGVSSLSPLILAIALGIVVRNGVGLPERARAGVAFAMRPVLRLAIVLLGAQLTAGQVLAVGGRGMAVIAATLVGTLLFTIWLGARLGVGQKLARLIAAGTAICGASAVIATNAVTGGSDEDVAYAVACVTVFGSLSMVAYPLLPGLLHLDAQGYGLWAGASIHEIAQVVAAAFQHGHAAGDVATVAKLSRVMLLAPVVLAFGALARRGAGGAAPMPWFVLGFIAVIGVNSFGMIGVAVKSVAIPATTFLLTLALAGMGLETDMRKLRARGLRPLALGAASWLFVALFSLALIEVAR